MGATFETWGHVDDNESIAAVHQALDLGINLIDTAPIYGLGHSEEIVGKALRGRRSEVVLATKCGLQFPRSKADAPVRCLRRESVIRECDASLRRLHTDVIDLYQCHWPDPATPIEETMDALKTLLSLGKIRAVGLSNFSVEDIRAARRHGPVHALQPPFSMIQYKAAEDLIPYCKEHRLAVLPYSPLAKGLLTGKFDEHTPLEGIRGRDPDFLGERYRRNLQLVRELAAVAERLGKTVAQVVLNWTTNYPGVTSVLVGAKRPTQVIENAGAVGWSLPEEARAEIDGIVRAFHAV